MRLLTLLALGAVFCQGLGCVGPLPMGDYSLARVAVESARKAGAPNLAPLFWHKSNRNYRQAVKFFHLNEARKAKEAFVRARIFAEKAENAAVLKKFQSGGGFQ